MKTNHLALKRGLTDKFVSTTNPIGIGKQMLFMLVLLVFCIGVSFGQSTVNYTFAKSTSGTLTTMTGSTQFFGKNQDDVRSAVTSFAVAGTSPEFGIWFMGKYYNQFSVNDNGILQLGTTQVATNDYDVIPPSAGTPVISAFANNMQTTNTNGAKVHWLVSGSYPNRTITIEWKMMEIRKGGGNDGTFQVRLNENNNSIEFLYNGMKVGKTSPTSYIGIANEDATNKFIVVKYSDESVNRTGSISSYSETNGSIGNITNLNTTGKTYTFTPTETTTPTGLTFNNMTASALDLSWTDNATDEVGYAVYRSTDNTNFTLLTTTPLVANTTTYTATSLTNGTTYYFRVYAVREALSTALAGSTYFGTTSYYTSATSTTPTNTAQWWANTNGTGAHPANFTTANQKFVIQNGHTMTTSAAWTVSGTNTTIEVESGGTLVANDLVTATDVNVAGALSCGTGSFTCSGTFTFSGTGNTNLPAGSYTNLTINRSGTITLCGNATVSGTLNLTNGFVATGSTYYLHVTNTAIAAIAGYSQISYINGNLRRTLQSGIGTNGTNYIFPIGEATAYRPLELIDIRTGVAPVISAVVTSSPAATTADETSISAMQARNWNVKEESGDFTSAFIQLTEATTFGDLIGKSSAQSGTYQSVGGTGGATTIKTTATVDDATLNHYFAIGSPSIKTFYSYQNGNWNNGTSWTFDPSGTTYFNPTALTPTSVNDVYILNGRTITATGAIAAKNLSIIEGAVLDLVGFAGTFISVKGQGLLRLNTATFPTGDFTDFVAATGGTVEYYNQATSANITLTQLTYNNLIVNKTGRTCIVAGNLTCNGNLTVSSGTLQINNTTATSRTLEILGSVKVNSTASVTTSTANVFHNFIVWGSFENNGTIRFTNRAAPVTYAYLTNEPTDGAVILTFKGQTNNDFLCNNTTDLYRLIVDKGTDQTYILTLNSTHVDYFRLFGPNDDPPPVFDFNNPNLDGILKNLWIKNGTLKLEGSINIPSLVEGGNDNFHIPLNGCLWLNSPDVVVNVTWADGTSSNQALVPFGKLRVDAGKIYLGQGAGLVFRGTAIIEINGGELVMGQFRPSSYSDLALTAFTMSGGIFTVDGNGEMNNAKAAFCLPSPTNSFSMSGGTINVKFATTSGAMVIGGTDYKVTGGDVNIVITNNNAYRVASTAPFYNFSVSKTGGTTTNVSIEDVVTTSPNVTVSPAWLKVLNELSILQANSPTLLMNNKDLFVAGDFIIETGATYTPGTNTTTLNAAGGQEFQINGTITGGLNNFTLSNESATVLTSTAPAAKQLTVNGVWTISTFCSISDNSHTINAKGIVSNSGTHQSAGSGKVILNGSTNQAIQGNGRGIFGNIELNNTAGATLSANLTIMNTLTFAGASGILDIGTYKLNLFNDAKTAVGYTSNAFSSTKMIRTAGFQSDGGVLKIFSDTPNNSFLFPIGTSTSYSPADISVTAISMGNVIVKPVADEQPYASSPTLTLRKYWKVQSELFENITAVTANFKYADTEVQGTESSYCAAYYTPFSFYTFNVSPNYVDAATNTVFFSRTGASCLDADYTAGQQAAFTTVKVYYSRQDGNWNDPNTWSNTSVGGAVGTGYPNQYSPVIIGAVDVNGNVLTAHTVTVTQDGTMSGSLELNNGSVLNVRSHIGLNFGAAPNQQIKGNGKLRISSSAGIAQFPGGDFGIFLGNEGGTVEYYNTASVDFKLPVASATGLGLATYYNLNLMPTAGQNITLPDINLTVYNDITSGAAATYTGSSYINTTTNPKTLTVNNNLTVNGGTFYCGGVNFAQSVVVKGDISVTASSFFQSPSGFTNTLAVFGNLTNNGTLNFKNGTGVINLTFKGNQSKNFTGTNASANTVLNYLTIDKGTNQTAVLNMDVAGNFNNSTALPDKWLIITNGTFRFAKPSPDQSKDISAGVYTIPASGCLSINATGAVLNIGNTASDAADLMLNGKLEVKKGTINIGQSSFATNNDIEYASAGSPEISIETGGTLLVNGQIRNNVNNNAGSLIYNQTGGELIVWGRNQVAAKPKFGVYNIGSIFNMSGGSITIKRGSGTIYSDVYLRPESSTVTEGSIIFDASTVGNQTYKIDANVPIHNLTVTGVAANLATVNVWVNPLVLLGSVEIAASNTLISNDLDITIGKDFTNSGTYTQGTNNTIFNGTGEQNMSCISATTFYKLTVNKNSGTLNLIGTQNPIVENIFSIAKGTFDTKDRKLFARFNVENSGTHVSTGTGDIELSGTNRQYISGNGLGKFANLTLNNANGVQLSSAISITKTLNFQSGMFHLDNNLLTFTETALLPANYTASKFITTNGVASDGGICKIFPVGNPNFFLPIGSLASGTNKYTPASYSFTNLSASGDLPCITVRPINSKHLATTDVLSKELKYYWNVTASNIAALDAISQIYTYLETDLTGTEALYTAGRLPENTTAWIQGGTVATTPNTITFTNTSTISGDYTAGEASEFQTVYTYRSRQNGNWNDFNTWERYNGTTWSNALSGEYPQGNPTIILSTNIVTANANSFSAITLQLDGTLNLSSTYAHNFVTLSGTGRLKMEPNGMGAFVFPAGNNVPFMNTAGSTIEYVSGTGSTISPVITTYQNLELSGSGSKSLANVDLLVKGNFTIKTGCGQFSNVGFDKNILIYGNWINGSSFPYLPGTGTVTFGGTAAQDISCTAAIDEGFYNLVINNAAGVNLNGDIAVANDLTINTNALFNSSSSKEISIVGDWINNSDIPFNSTNGTVTFKGTEAQTYYALAEEVFNNLTINNSKGVTALCNTLQNGTLTFTNGKINIGDYLYSLSTDAGVSGSGAGKYIETNGLASDAGVIKQFTTTTNFTFPVGSSSKYTPVQFSGTNTSATTGTISVKPVNSRHPFANNNITDELQYYWIVKTSNITPSAVSHTYTFAAADALPSTSNYVAARFSDDAWTQTDATNIVGATTISYPSRNYLDGEYTCGVQTNFGLVPTYYSRNFAANIRTTGADWHDLNTWSTRGHSDNIFIPNTLPNGNAVIIASGHIVETFEDEIKIASLELKGTSTEQSVLLLNATADHDFGSIIGKGKLSLTNNASGKFVLPTANITNFVAAGGGTIEYSGTGDLPNQATYNNLRFVGDGNKNLPNYTTMTINGNIEIAEGQLTNKFNTDISIKGNWIDGVANGGFTDGGGMVRFNSTTAAQNIYSNITTKFYNLRINNALGLTLQSPAQVTNFLTLANGKINTSAGKELTLSNSNAGIVTGGSATSFVNGPLNKVIDAGGSFSFPVGTGSTYNPITLSSATADTWQAQFYLANYNSANIQDPIVEVSSAEYWRAKSLNTSGEAVITLPYGAPSGITAKHVVAEYSDTDNKWTNYNSGSTTNSVAGTVTGNEAATFNNFAAGNYFTIGSTNLIIWLGVVSSDWFDPLNWSPAKVPDKTENVKIPESCPNYPILTVNLAECKQITIDANAEFTLNGVNFDVYGNWINNSTLCTTIPTSTVSFKGTTVITGSEINTFGNIAISGTLTAHDVNTIVVGNVVNNGTLNAPATSSITFDGTTTLSGSGIYSFNAVDIEGTLTAPTGNMNVVSNWINNGTFNAPAGSKITFSGNTAISGSSENSFAGIEITGTLTAPLNGNINVAENWTNSGTFAHNNGMVTFNGTSTITKGTIGETFNNFTVSTGSEVNVASNTRIEVEGVADLTGNFTLKSDATGTASFIDKGTIIGNGVVTVERHINPDGWHYIASPMTGISNKVVTEQLNCYSYNRNLIQYNEAYTGTDWQAGWVWGFLTPNTNTLEVPRGYAAFIDNSCSQVIKFIGTSAMLNTGNKSITVTNQDQTAILNGVLRRGWNLIGNPYPSHLDADAFLTANSGVIDGAVYFWDENGKTGFNADGKDYAVWNFAGAVGTGTGDGGGSVVPDGTISLGQSFYVHKTSTGSGSVTFNNTMRSSNKAHFYKRGGYFQRIKLAVTNPQNHYNETLIALSYNATDGFDSRFDAVKMKGNQKLALFSMLNGNAYAIQTISPIETESKVIPIGLSSTIVGTHTFTVPLVENIDMLVYLEDRLLNKTISLNRNSTYTFTTTTAGDINNRFFIRFALNTAPKAIGTIDNQTVMQDSELKLNLKQDLFVETDVLDQLSYKALQTNGLPLPAWLSFNSSTMTFEGTPQSDDVANYSIALTATDLAGAWATINFNINVLNRNKAPIAKRSELDYKIVQDGTSSQFTIPADVFTDPDKGDKLSYSATCRYAMPEWIVFDNQKLTFTVSPNIQRDTTLVIAITATDIEKTSATTNLRLFVQNINDAPYVNLALADATTKTESLFAMNLSNTFADLDVEDELTYQVRLANGTELPEWLVFDNQNFTLSGTPQKADVGILSITVVATDKSGAEAVNAFTLQVDLYSHQPQLVNAISNQLYRNKTIEFVVPQNTFADPEPNDVLTYTATMADDSALPDWLIFDSETLTFTATFPQKGMYEIVLIATDRNGDKAWCSIIFRYEYAVSVELTNETQFNLYPNPSTGMFTVQTEEVGMLTIFDALGKVMIEKQLNDKWNKINASQLPQGVYFAELKTAGGTYYRKVLITR